jgi:hypothetical protein
MSANSTTTHSGHRLTLTGLSKNCNPSLDITEVQRVLKPRHSVSSLLSNDLHHGELLRVASDEVEEG